MPLQFCGQTQDNTSQRLPDTALWSTQPSVFAILQIFSCSFCRPSNTLDQRNIWKTSNSWICRCQIRCGRGRLEGCLQGSREGETGLFWKMFGQAVQGPPRVPGQIFIGYAWQSNTINVCPKEAFRDIFFGQGLERLSFAVSRKAVPRNAPLFWCQAGISYVALDLPGFEAPVTKFVFHFRSSTTRKSLTQLTCCRVLMPGRCEALLQSHVVSTFGFSLSL